MPQVTAVLRLCRRLPLFITLLLGLWASGARADEPLLTGILAGVHREQRPYLDDATIEAAERMRRRYGGYDE